ncbi:hypothetical protein BJY04DRAFT_226490 [Aspergillus karnatakaensis]|uniref:uncharacterized protein n=1 Tax=Aspergillus karnatakaensis TaxID=1810916 RepID=UPI003CCCA887
MPPITDVSPDQLPTLELTPLERTLKTLLLDVARHAPEDGSGTHHDVGPSETVLRFTGGWVRDKLLGVESHDIDVAITNMTGYHFGMKLKEYLDIPENLDKYRKNHENGELQHALIRLHKIDANPEKSKHLETVTTRIFGFDVDLVNLRKESYTADSRTPQMEFGTAEEDALRRDATINALFYNLNESKVEDLTQRGLADMRAGIIRTPLEPYQTFVDDPLRVLRLIRFASRLGYHIDRDTEEAMQHIDIGSALKLKISKERVGIEVEKMLRGPDPRRALHIVDRLNLYPTIFANQIDDAEADTSTWFHAYNALHRLLTSKDEPEDISHVRTILIRDSLEEYYSWIISAFAPWSAVAPRAQGEKKGKPPLPRAAEVARDCLRADNKTVDVLTHAAAAWRDIIDVKYAVVEGRMQGTAAEVRQQVGLHIRSWSKDWRLCILLSLLHEIMQGGEFIDVVKSYDQFISYILEQGLEGACELKPIVNGGDVMKTFKAKMGPWMSKALDLVIQWQLLNPDIHDKQRALEYLESKREELELRIAAREALQQPAVASIPDSALSNNAISFDLEQLWREISPYSGPENTKNLENLLLAQAFLRSQDHKSLSDADKAAINSLYKQEESRRRSTFALSVISLLAGLLPLKDVEPVQDVTIAIASLSSETDPWTTREASTTAITLLSGLVKSLERSSLWGIIEATLKTRIRPLFAKSKNPSITETGRKNFHPVPPPRFDQSIFDSETKPWRTHAAYITTVFSWVVEQYQAVDRTYLEAHFPLIVPSILTLIDDDSLSSKCTGCTLLTKLLIPIRTSNSDILRRTNLSSVFEDAIRPCFHSLPTITPEDESIDLLSAAYPALRSLLLTSYPRPPQGQNEQFLFATVKTLRDHLIPSFHHISSTTASANSTSTLSSFPHPRLSTLLLDQMAIVCSDLGIHTTKYLQDIVPLIYSTLSNPFGPAYPPLLRAATCLARAVVLNAYPRLWRWRGEILGAICSCWVYILEDEVEQLRTASTNRGSQEGEKATELQSLKREFRGVVYLLRYALENPVSVNEDQGQREAQEKIAGELQTLVDADESLRECLLNEIDREDGVYFGLES